MILIFGASGNIHDVDTFIQQLLSFSNKHHVVVQVFDAKAIYSLDHLISATTHARRAFHQGTNATGSLALEILLYAAGERQIEKAIKKIGIRKGKQKMAFVITDSLESKGDTTLDNAVKKKLLTLFHLASDDTSIQGNLTTLKRFGISKQELSAVPKDHYGDLILERVALVDVIKK